MINLIKDRKYQVSDYEKVMDFLREMYSLTGKQHCWLPQRWEYAEYHCNPLYVNRGWEDWKNYIRIWEENKKIVAIAHKETGFDIFMQIRPDYEFLANDMLEYLETTVTLDRNCEKCELWLYVNSSQRWIEEKLINRGYLKNDECCYYNYINLSGNFIPKLPEGFRFVDGTDIKDKKARYLCCHLGFHPDDEPNSIPSFDLHMEHAPMFNPKFEIMTQDKDGNLCSFCVAWYDQKLKIGMIEPVCTRINYRMKGLGKQMLIESLRRLKEIGAEKVYVESFGDKRKRFYNSVGFITYDCDYPWRKKF